MDQCVLYIKRYGDYNCMLWFGTKNRQGYGVIGRSTNGMRKQYRVHRYIYEKLTGEKLLSKEIHHACGNKLCVNTDHMVVTTVSEHRKNVLRKIICRNGHVRTKGSVLVNKLGHLRCKACAKNASTKYRNSHREKVREYLREYNRTSDKRRKYSAEYQRTRRKLIREGLWDGRTSLR